MCAQLFPKMGSSPEACGITYGAMSPPFWPLRSMCAKEHGHVKRLCCPNDGRYMTSRSFSQSLASLCSYHVVAQSLSHVWLLATLWTAARQTSLSFTTSQSLLKLMCIELVMPSNRLTLCHPVLLLPSIFASILPLLPSKRPQQTKPGYLTCSCCHFLFSEQTGGWL